MWVGPGSVMSDGMKRSAAPVRLFEPLHVGNLHLPNRIKMPALVMAPQGSREDVLRYLEGFYVERAGGGVALMGVSCTPTRLVCDPMVPLFDDSWLDGLRRLTSSIHAEGAHVYAQMGVGYSWAFGDGPVELVSPSGVSVTGRPGTPFRMGGPFEPSMPRALSVDEIREMVRTYGEGARRAREAGFDAVEVIASAGYVISQFLSPLTNHRTDEYGGSLENRMRFLLEIVGEMRAQSGADFTFMCRLSGADMLDGGYTLDDTVRMAQTLESAGIDEVDIMPGWHNAPVAMIQEEVPQGAWVYLAEAVKRAVGIPVAAGTQIRDVSVAEQVLEQGRADLVYMARALLADPHLPNKARQGRLDEIRPCIDCCRCVEMSDSPPVYCSVNPRLGREGEFPDEAPAEQAKRVLVIGGGPAGIEAARAASVRGHEVTLCERDSKLGGSLVPASVVNKRIGPFVRYLVAEMQRLPVEVRLNREATRAAVVEAGPDVVLVATGGHRNGTGVRAAGNRILRPQDVRELLRPEVRTVIIVGGGLVGCQIAVALVERGKSVIVLEESERIGGDVGPVHRWLWLRKLRTAGARLETGVRILEAGRNAITIEKKEGPEHLEADAVLLASRMGPDEESARSMSGLAPVVLRIGDCAEPGRLLEAVASGYLAGRSI